MFLSTAAPRLVIDPFDTSLTNTPGAVTFSDPGRATNAKRESWREAATARFVPRDLDDLDALDAVYGWCFSHFPRFVWTNECADTLPARGYPRRGKTLIAQGAKRQIGHLGETQRPREIMRSLVANAHHLLVWPMPNPDDVAHLASATGVPSGVLAGELGRLKPFEFVWCNLVTGKLTSCPAIKP